MGLVLIGMLVASMVLLGDVAEAHGKKAFPGSKAQTQGT
jgi:hypothetical protein